MFGSESQRCAASAPLSVPPLHERHDSFNQVRHRVTIASESLNSTNELLELKSEHNAAANIEGVEIVLVAHGPASTPERIAPVSSGICAVEISRHPLHLSPEANVRRHIIFRASSQRQGKVRCIGDAMPVRGKIVCSEPKREIRSQTDVTRG